MDNLINTLSGMRDQITQMMQQLNIEAKAQEIRVLEEEASAPDFWNDSDNAQKKMQRMSRLKNQVDKWQKVLQRFEDTIELAELDDPDLAEELNSEGEALVKIFDELSLQAMLSGDYDAEDAILSIHAGAGGTEAQDWAQMLERMYLRWFDQSGYKYDIIEKTHGEEAGIKSVTISVKGDYAYGYLQSEQGVHRLVRISPYDSNSRRHTSFAKVELYPDIAGEIEIEVKEADIRVDKYRASGPGGQSVNTTDSAVRITHLPTGTVVQSQNQKSQLQNKEQALRVLKARLLELERQKQDAEIAALKGENVDAGWGNQIRSYVLHPYQMVKDLRTRHETSQAQSVLDGKLDDFMESYLRYKIGDSITEDTQ
ncbi:MAG: peptide chain release factor 2 [Anaerolineae bacterium]|nr:peptide chain release factor 2 [Anaerolineae bacterium]MDQ7037407.1 peptide chain release factor 2 [Anaerolineae bacterium]